MKPLVFLGEAMGANEVRIGKGFVGASGIELLKMSHDAGLIALTEADQGCLSRFWQTSKPDFVDAVWEAHPEVRRMNVFNLHPPGNKLEALCGPREDAIAGYPALLKSKYALASIAVPELERLADELIATDPNLILALGNTPMWALCGASAISKIRGTTRLSTHCVEGFKVLPTYHPAAVIRQWELRPTTVADLMKARREREFPEIRRTEREVWIEPTLEDMEEFLDLYVPDDCLLSVDIETAGNQVTCIGLAPSTRIALVVPFLDTREPSRSYWANKQDEGRAWGLVRNVLESRRPKKLFQNGLYDIAFLWRSVGIRVRGAEQDTMLLHHALQPESLKGLAFLGSLYADESAWKSERKGKKTKTIKRDA